MPNWGSGTLLRQLVINEYGQSVAGRTYDDIDPKVLKALPNPGGAMELKHKAPEVTFLGARDQPDFGTLYITFYPRETVIELKSLKEYLYQWRNTAVSYERFLDVVFEHLIQVYKPVRLRLVLETRPRGGISSKLTVDSDWAIRGGKEQFRDWVRLEDTW
jgi:7-cyano-7-deazaguanine reductase